MIRAGMKQKRQTSGTKVKMHFLADSYAFRLSDSSFI